MKRDGEARYEMWAGNGNEADNNMRNESERGLSPVSG